MTTIAELLNEFDTRLGVNAEPELLTLTEGRGFVPQRERFNKRLATEDTSNYKVVKTNDIAYNQYLLWAGAIAQNTSDQPGIISPAYPTFRVRDGFDPRYVIRLLSTHNMRLRFNSISFGAVPRRRRAKVEDFLALEIPEVPPLEEQKRIAAILEKADELRTKRKEAIAELDKLQQSVFLDMFGDPVTNEKGFEVLSLADLVSPERPITYGILKPGPDMQTGVPYVRVLDIRGERVLVDQLRKTTEEIASKYRRSQLLPGDLLVSIRGHVGRMAITPSEASGANITQDTARVSLAACDPHYVMQCLSTMSMQRYMARRTKGAAVKGINLGDLKAIPIPVPPYGLQERYRSISLAVSATRAAHEKYLQEADSLFLSLQSRAFRGEL